METPRKLGFVLLGGATTGALIKEIRFINELAARGCECHVWWAFERNYQTELHPSVQQRWLFHHARYASYWKAALRLPHWRQFEDFCGRQVSRFGGEPLRRRALSAFPGLVDWGFRELIIRICRGVGEDQSLIRRFGRELTDSGVTHVFPMLEILAPFILAARRQVPRSIGCTVTFQGYELYTHAAHQVGLEERFLRVLRECARESGSVPLTLSRPYANRIEREVGLSAEELQLVAPGVPEADPIDAGLARQQILEQFGIDVQRRPLITFLGRVDSEKGIDLLLMAARILAGQGHQFQIVVCGGSAFGNTCRETCQSIARHLEIDVCWTGYVSDEMRSAVMTASHCVVYPSIHHEPFGMVPVEAMSHGTPVVVSDTGGVSELVTWQERRAGLTFRSWDSGDLAVQLERLLTQSDLYASLKAETRLIASKYSIARMTDEILSSIRSSADRKSTLRAA